MKFRPHGTLFFYGIVGFIIIPTSLLISIFSLIEIQGIGYKLKAGIMLVICLFANLGIWKRRDMFFAKVELTKKGIVLECILKKRSLFLWEDVKDCGIINATTSPIDKIYCIYFSPEKLTISQKLGKVTNIKDKNEVMSKLVKIPLCIDAINEIERYAPERILDLLKNDSVYQYTEIVAEFREQAEKRKNKKNK